jgi:hypothetical protein
MITIRFSKSIVEKLQKNLEIALAFSNIRGRLRKRKIKHAKPVAEVAMA